MSIPTRPTGHPDWATNATHTVGPNVGQPNKVALTIEATEGNVDGVTYPPDARKFNLWQNLVGLWVRWVEAFLDYIWARQLPVPEDYLGLETAAEVDAAGTWHTYINAMLAGAAVSSARACGMTAGRNYECSGKIIFPAGVRLWDGQGAAITGDYDAIGVEFDGVHNGFWATVKQLTLRENYSNQSYAWFIKNASYVRLVDCGLANYGSMSTSVLAGFVVGGSANNHHIQIVRPWVDDIKGDPDAVTNNVTAIYVLPSASLRHTIDIIDPVVTGYGQTKVAIGIDGLTKGINVVNPQLNNTFGGAITVGYSGAATEAKITTGRIVDGVLGGIYHLGTGRLEVDGTEVDACGGGYASIGEGAVSNGNTGLFIGRNIVVKRAGKTSAGATRSGAAASGFYSPTTCRSNWDLQGCRVEDSVGYNYRLTGVGTATLHGNTGKNPGYGLGVYTASFYVRGKDDAVSYVSILGNTAYDPATGFGGGFSVGPGDAAFPMIGDFVDNHSFGNGVTGSVGISCNVEGLVERNYAHNYDEAFFYLGDQLGRKCFYRNNVINTCNTGITGNIAAGSTWNYLEGQVYINVTTRYAFSGAGASRVKEAIQLFPKRIILSDVEPIATEEKWDLGDEIRPATTALTTNEVARFCAVASVDYSDVGTWKKLVGVTL